MMHARNDMLRVFLNGLSTGVILQLAIGPVFFFILNISLQRTMMDGLCSVAAVTMVDYLYILLAIVGVGKLLEKRRISTILGVVSAVVLIIFGIIMLASVKSVLSQTAMPVQARSNYGSSFLSAFLLTISSPLTIVFWTSLFASKAIEHGYTKKSLAIFGMSAGLATLVFLGGAVLIFSFAKTSIPLLLVKTLNALVGMVLMGYGIIRFINVFKKVTPEPLGGQGD